MVAMSREDAPPLITAGDFGLAIGLPLLALTAWLTPERAWTSLARALAPHAGAVLSRGRRDLAARVEAVAGADRLPCPADAVAVELAASEIERNLQVLRDHLPIRWRPDIDIIGLEHLHAAMDKGRGAILWDSHFQFAAVVTKMALMGAGVGLHHLSHPRHGFSNSRFGMVVLNPVRTRCEGRYVAERVVLSLDGPVAAMRALLKRLKNNGVVSITVRGTGAKPCHVPFLGGHVSVATGALDLAYRADAPLLPVFTVRNGERYRVTIEAPLIVDRSAGRTEAAAAAAAEYARRLEPHVVAHPGQWAEWISI
jgi:lauroyl/myristoyl acyltransferase